MIMNRHRSTSRSHARAAAREAAAASESRQPEEDGRRSSGGRLHLAPGAAPPRTPRSAASASTAGGTAASLPAAPHSAPATPNPGGNFPKARCYRLNLEKPFDIRQQKSPLGRDYSGPPVHDSDLPPAQGPMEYHPPPHLCSKEDLWRRHSFGGFPGSGGASTPSELMANLHVSVSEESSNEASDPTTIAISTARIFRGIVVDRNGVITSMNSRAMRSQRGKNGGENKNKMGEKSRQAAKIDKAKDLIDDAENGAGGMGDEENDPTKIVSLFVMGEYEELNDLVRDGSKKLRDSKSLTDEAVLLYARPRPFPPGMHPSQQAQAQQQATPMSLSPTGGSGAAPCQAGTSPYSPASSPPPQFAADPAVSAASPTSATAALSNAPSPSNLRKRVFSADKSRGSRYKQPPPKLKASTRDSGSVGKRSTRAGGSGASGATSPSGSHHGYHRNNSVASSHHAQQQQRTRGMLCNPTSPARPPAASDAPGNKPHHYFQQQCNFLPGTSDWAEAIGFSVNSLWNCGANGGYQSPTMSPHSAASPRGGNSSQHGHGDGSVHAPAPATGGGVYHGSGAAGAGYHHPTTGNYHHQSPGGGAGYGGGGGYGSYSTNAGGGYRGDVEGRNPSSGGYNGYGRTGTGVRDTVVM